MIKRYFNIVLLAICAFIVFATTNAQDITFKSYGVDEGIIQSQIISITQDNDGFLWFGSLSGLSRFDGKNFKYYVKSDGLPSVMINDIIEDKNGVLWIGTINGLCRYKNDKFTILDTLQSSIKQQLNVSVLFEDNSNNIWIGTAGNGLYKFNGQYFGHYNEFDPSFPLNIKSIFQDKNNVIWIGSDKGVYKYEGFEFKEAKKINQKLKNKTINTLFIDSKENFWIGTTDGLYTFPNLFVRKIRAVDGLSDRRIIKIFQDIHSNIWIGTESGLNLISNGIIKNYSTVDGLNHNTIRDIYEDNEHNLWIGTNGGGVNRVEYKPFKTITTDDGLKNNQVWAFLEVEKGKFYIGTDEGIFIWNGKIISQIYKNNGLLNNFIIGLTKDRLGRVWAFSNGGGIAIIVDDKVVVNITEENGLPSNSIYFMVEDKSGNHWIATRNGISKYDGYTFRNYSSEDGLTNLRVTKLLIDSHDVLWATTYNGVSRLIGNRFESVLIDEITDVAVSSIIEDSRGTFWFSTYGKGLVHFIPGTKDSVEVFSKDNGFRENQIYFVIEDKDGNIWAGTDHGLNKINYSKVIDSKNTIIKHYNTSDGFIGPECNQNAVLKDSENNLWFGTIEGVNIYRPQYDKFNTKEPQLHLLDIKLFNNKVDWSINSDSLLEKNIPYNLKLPYDKNHLTFDFIGICFSDPSKVQYSYKMDGFDKDWSHISSNSSVSYSYLPAGKYKFKLKSANNSGVWNSTPLQYSFEITPPFYKTSWFLIIISLLIIGAIFGYIKLRTKFLEEQKIKLEDLVIARTKEVSIKANELESVNKILKDVNNKLLLSEEKFKKLNLDKDKLFSIISHDLKSPFNSILGFTRMLLDEFDSFKKEDIKENIFSINRSLGRIYSLIENLLEWSMLQNKGIKYNPEDFRITDVIHDVDEVLHYTFSKKKIQFVIDAKSSLSVYADKNMINTVFRNLLTNAVKFTNIGGTIKIKATQIDENVEIVIEDNGVGITKEELTLLFQIDKNHTSLGTDNEKGTGLGLILCKELIEKNKGEISVSSVKNKGTTITLLIPATL